jgi:hypothetical protein
MQRPIFKIEFPTLGMLVCGLVCGLSLYTNNEKGLVAAQTIAAIAGTAYQSHVNAIKATRKATKEQEQAEESSEIYFEESNLVENKPVHPPYYRE